MTRSLPCFCGYDCTGNCNCEICHEIHMQTIETPFIKRFKSFLWRAAMLGLAGALGWMLNNLEILHLGPVVTTVLGLVLGEISKYLNTKTA